MASVAVFREHAAIDGDITDAQLGLYLNAAMGYLEQSEVLAPSASEAAAHPAAAALYDLAAYQIGTHYYDKRGLIGQDVPPEVFGVQGIIHQLKGYFTGKEAD